MGKPEDKNIMENEDWIYYERVLPTGKKVVVLAETITHKLRNSGLPESCKKAKLNFNNEICKALRSFKGGQIVLSGTYGCGKTFGMYAWVLEKLKEDKRVLCKDANSFYLELKDFDTNEWTLNECKTVDILIIDDIGVEYDAQSGYFQSMIDDIINYRYNRELTTIITTNLTLEKFKERYGGRVIDRLRDSGGFFESKDKSFRGK